MPSRLNPTYNQGSLLRATLLACLLGAHRGDQDPIPRLRAGDLAEALAPLVRGAALGPEGLRRRGVLLQLRGGHHAQVREDVARIPTEFGITFV